MRIKRILGWLLIAPLAVNVGVELYLLVLIAFQGSDFDQRWMAFSFAAFPLFVTGPLAYVGWRLVRSGQLVQEPPPTIETVTEGDSSTRISGWVLVTISIVVMAFALLDVLLDITLLARFIKVFATIGILILFASPLIASIKRIRSSARKRQSI